MLLDGCPVGQSEPAVAFIGSMLGAHRVNDIKNGSTVALFGMLWGELLWIITYCNKDFLHYWVVAHKLKWFGMGNTTGQDSCYSYIIIWYDEQFEWLVKLMTFHLKKIEFEVLKSYCHFLRFYWDLAYFPMRFLTYRMQKQPCAQANVVWHYTNIFTNI